MNATVMVSCKLSVVQYEGIERVHIDKEGNLRLFRKRGWWRQTADIFHPAHEWLSYRFSRGME